MVTQQLFSILPGVLFTELRVELMNGFELSAVVFEPWPILHEGLVNSCSWQFDHCVFRFLSLNKIFVIIRGALGNVGHLVVREVAVVLCKLSNLLVQSSFESKFALVLALTSNLLIGSLSHHHLAVDLLVSILKFH